MIVERIKNVGRKLSGTMPAGRKVTVFDDDVFITSYPRSGNTWFRFLVANLKSDGQAGFSNIETLVPDIYQNSDAVMRRSPRPRILKSHEAFDARYPRVIYLIRDPRDVAVSYHRFLIKRRYLRDRYPIGRFIERYLTGDLPFGSWGDNVRSWVSAKEGSPDFILVRYEDLLADPGHQLRQIAPVLSLDPEDPARFQRAVEQSSAERMRDLEKKEGKEWATTRSSRSDKPFVGAASSGTWMKALDARDVSRIEDAWGDLMTRFHYLADKE